MLSNTFILHHYDLSPYAEKVRLLLGMANAAWGSVLTPAMPPRPSVEPLAGGYRRIPVAQMGADLFCDSRLIAAELAQWTGLPHLSPQATPESAAALVRRAEGDVFFAAAGAAPTHVLLGTVLRNFGLLGSLRFAFDRIHMVRSAASPPPQGRAAMRMYQQFQADLNGVLAQHPILSGDTPGYADVALYHVVWLNTQARRAPLTDDHPHLKRWFERIASLGHGRRTEMTPDQAFAAARDAEPRPLPDTNPKDALYSSLGQRVAVHPTDYLPTPTVGELVAVTEERFTVARQTPDLGHIHVHFPREGFTVSQDKA